MCSTGKAHMSDKFYSGMSYNAAGHEFSVRESTILNIKYSVFSKKCT